MEDNIGLLETRPLKAPWEIHMDSTVKYFAERYKQKYSRGAKEHGGNLHRKPALDMIEWAFDETLDLVSYHSVLRSHVLMIQKIVDDVMESPLNPETEAMKMRSAIVKIKNIIYVGNPEGERQEGD